MEEPRVFVLLVLAACLFACEGRVDASQHDPDEQTTVIRRATDDKETRRNSSGDKQTPGEPEDNMKVDKLKPLGDPEWDRARDIAKANLPGEIVVLEPIEHEGHRLPYFFVGRSSERRAQLLIHDGALVPRRSGPEKLTGYLAGIGFPTSTVQPMHLYELLAYFQVEIPGDRPSPLRPIPESKRSDAESHLRASFDLRDRELPLMELEQNSKGARLYLYRKHRPSSMLPGKPTGTTGGTLPVLQRVVFTFDKRAQLAIHIEEKTRKNRWKKVAP